MKLNQAAIDEFKRAYTADYGEELADSEAEEMAGRLLRLAEILSVKAESTGDHASGTAFPQQQN